MKKISIVLFLMLMNEIYSNVGAVAKGTLGTGNYYFIHNHDIEILYEDLRIDLYKTYAEVKVKYQVKNNGKGQTVEAGFPSIAYDEKCEKGYQGPCYVVKHREIEEYKVMVNNNEIKYALENGVVYPIKFSKRVSEVTEYETYLDIYKSTLSFEAGEMKEIVISYISKYQAYSYGIEESNGYTSNDEYIFRYLLSPGSTWSGTIKEGKVAINIKNKDLTGYSVYPENRFKKNGDSLVWTFKNLNPVVDDDIVINFNNSISNEYMGVVENEKFRGITEFSLTGEKYGDLVAKSVTASSYLIAGRREYKVQNLYPYNSEYYCEGVPGDGKGEYILFDFSDGRKIDKVGIINGLTRTKELYYKNSRLKKIQVIINNKYQQLFELPDEYVYYDDYRAYSIFDLMPIKEPVRTLKMIIMDIYKGTKYEDTCMSKVIFLEKLEN